MKSRPARIVILGAGYAGLRAVLDLAQACRAGKIDAGLTLIDRNADHQVITRLHQTATEALPAQSARLSLEKLLPGQVALMRAGIESIDLEAGFVSTTGGRVEYDRLVVALGSETDYPSIPGLRQHALALRWCSDAERLRRHVREQFERAGKTRSRSERQKRLRLVVAGGGFTGCQLVGEMAHWVTGLADAYRVRVTDIHLLLLEAGSSLLPSWESVDARRAESLLRHKGVDVRLRSPLQSVSADELRFDGDTLASHTVIWTGGIRAPSLLAESGLPVADQGRVPVDACLRVTDTPEIYVAGDSALVRRGGRPLPANASLALRQGAYVASTLVEDLNGRSLPPYRPADLGMLVSLGGSDAVGDLLGVPLQGFPAGWAKEGIEQWYELTVLNRLPLAGP